MSMSEKQQKTPQEREQARKTLIQLLVIFALLAVIVWLGINICWALIVIPLAVLGIR